MQQRNDRGQEKRTDSERFGRRSTPGLDPANLSSKGGGTMPEGGLSARGEGTPLKPDTEQTSKPAPKHSTDEGSLNGQESQRGMNLMGVDQRGRQGTANQHNG